MPGSYQKAARDTIIFGVTILVTFLLGLIQLPLLTKTLGAHDYGIWTQVSATVGLIIPLTCLGLGNALIRFLAAEKDKEEIQEGFYSIVSIIFLTNLVAAAAVFIFAHPLATKFFDGAVRIVRITAILVLLSPVSSQYLYLIRAFQQNIKYCIFTIAESVSQLGLIVCLVLNGYGILSVVLSMVVIKFIIFFILFFSIKRQIGIKRPHFRRLKEYLSFGLPFVATGISSWVVNLSDRYVIGFFLGVTSVGIYSAAYGIGWLSYTIVTVIAFTLAPALPPLYEEGRMSEVKTHLSYSLKYFLAITIPFVFGAAILDEPVLRLFTTAEIASQGRFVLPLVALAALLWGIHQIIYPILGLVKKTKILAPIWAVAALVNLGLNILVVPRMGILGAAITTLIACSLGLGLTTYYAFKEFKFAIDWRFIIKSLIASAVMSLVIWLIAPQGNLDAILTVVAGIAVYGICIMLLRGFSKEEISFFKGLLRRSPPAANPNDGKAK